MKEMCHGTAIGCQPQIECAAGDVLNPPALTDKQVLLNFTATNTSAPQFYRVRTS